MNLIIFGDSYSTYFGHVPEGNRCYYGIERTDGGPILSGVDKTWWGRLLAHTGANLVRNESFSGSSVCKTGYPDYDESTSFVARAEPYFQTGFFSANAVDTAIVFGGTNDAWSESPLGSVDGTDLYEVLPAFRHLLTRLKKENLRVVCIVNCGYPSELEAGILQVCADTGAESIVLSEIEKVNGHPTERGMEQIFNQIKPLF